MKFKRTVGPKGQVVIPKDVREHLSVEPRGEVVFEVREDGVLMKRSQAPAEFVEEYVSIVTRKLKSKVQLEQIIEEEASEEIALRRQ